MNMVGQNESDDIFCLWSESQGTYDNRVISFALPIPLKK